MALAREEVIALLQGAVPDAHVLPYPRNIDTPSKSTVMYRIDTVEPSKAASGSWDVSGSLILIASATTSGPADEELDALLQDVLVALDTDQVPGMRWVSAKRATYGDPDPTNPAYEVEVTVTTSKE